jgi:hypothetical protein
MVASSKPDIYYIILDGYGREDVIEAFFDFDNSPFLNRLEDHGFYIASASQSNYTITCLSLASSMNMEYLDQIMDFPSTDPHCTHTARKLLSSGEVMDILRGEGYQIIAIASNYEFTEVRNADLYICPKGKQLNGFEAMLLHNSVLGFVYDISILTNGSLEYPGHQSHRDHINFVFDELAKTPKKAGQNFIFAHILSPHPPFVFGPNSETIKQRLPFVLLDGDSFPGTHEEYHEGYKNQLMYINQKVEELIEILLEESENAPIIILQGDHGPKSSMEGKTKTPEILRESVAILNGYYFPGHDYSALYPNISPVNTFRVILNQFFGKDYTLLPDRSYFSFEACNGVSDLVPQQNDLIQIP